MKLIVAAILLGSFLTGPASAQDGKSPPRVLFPNVKVFDGTSDRLLDKASVLVEGNMIRVVSDDPTQDIRLLMDSANLVLIMKDSKIYNNEL
jgi:hypothetical protein